MGLLATITHLLRVCDQVMGLLTTITHPVACMRSGDGAFDYNN
jgi:hypothetical protein